MRQEVDMFLSNKRLICCCQHKHYVIKLDEKTKNRHSNIASEKLKNRSYFVCSLTIFRFFKVMSIYLS